MSDSPEGPVLVLRHAAKSFGAVQALVDGSIELNPGEVHALVGENGAGKSTLVKILAGVYQPDTGALLRRSGWRSTGAALDRMAATEVNARWQRDMAPYFTELDGLPLDQGFKRVGEIFHVD